MANFKNKNDILAAVVREGEGGDHVLGLMTLNANDANPLSASNARLVAGSTFTVLLANCIVFDSQGNPAIRVGEAERLLTPNGIEAQSRWSGDSLDHLKKIFCEDDNGNLAVAMVKTYATEAQHTDYTP